LEYLADPEEKKEGLGQGGTGIHTVLDGQAPSVQTIEGTKYLKAENVKIRIAEPVDAAIVGKVRGTGRVILGGVALALQVGEKDLEKEQRGRNF